MVSERVLSEMVGRIQRFPDLAGCVVGFQGNGSCRVLRPGACVSPTSENVAVVIEEVIVDDPVVVNENKRFAASPGGSPERTPNPAVVTNRSRLGPELLGAGLTCGFTAVSAVGVLAGAAAEVPTGGASTFLIVASWTGLTMGAIQCMNGLVRVGFAFANPNDNTLERWDANRVYSAVSLMVDGLGIAGGVGSLPFSSRNLWAVLSRQRGFIARNLGFDAFRAMNRAQRLKVISEVFEEAARSQEGREALVKAAREAQIGAKTLQGTGGLSVNHAETLRRVISDETVRRLTSSLRDVLGSLGVVGASASPSRIVGSASGSVNFVVNLLDAGAPKF
jgi:hypothetical protein